MITFLIIAIASKGALFIAWRFVPIRNKFLITDFIRRALGFFDSNGLRYSKQHIDDVYRKIPFWPIEKQARYRDRVCELSVIRSTERDCVDIRSKPHYATFDATSVGNLAFIALYSLNPDYKAWALHVLNQYRIWAKR